MEKCNSWESQIVSFYSISEKEEKEIQRCLATLNYEECNCNGNKENCNFNFYVQHGRNVANGSKKWKNLYM